MPLSAMVVACVAEYAPPSPSWKETVSAARDELVTKKRATRTSGESRWVRMIRPPQVESGSLRPVILARVHPGVNRSDAREDAGNAHSAAHAHGDDAVLRVATTHLVQQLSGQLGPCASQRMTECDGAAVHVEFLVGDLECARDVHGLRREGFVELDHADVVERETGLLQDFGNREYGTDAHELGFDAHGGK